MAGNAPGGRAPHGIDCAEASVVVLTLNAIRHLPELLPRLDTRPAPRRVLFLDSSSDDGTAAVLARSGHQVHSIPRDAFGHGSTRNLAASLCADSRFVVFLTQDAYPERADWLQQLLVPFRDPRVAVSFGRQLPRPGAGFAERFARAFNYPDRAETTTATDLGTRGIKAVFCSNSFAAYRQDALRAVGGFPEDLPLGEDMAVTARMLQAGHARAYWPQARAIHSHQYGLREEFSRYFDIGALLGRDAALRQARRSAPGEGTSLLRAELRSAAREGGMALAAGVVLRTAVKLAGYKLGERSGLLPRALCRVISVHGTFWGRA